MLFVIAVVLCLQLSNATLISNCSDWSAYKESYSKSFDSESNILGKLKSSTFR